ncbi:MAG: hypothetical protein CVV50_00670 [Spirochaetae bacterium HGW-Spirochaetae-6]|jgi:HD-GYP domain-containing protein (c-di-GMP phosphodiesterase class II)|nr:MAG: hypothetical protein CVV50_00670 [Spirochaetae bacterium HGW-Spirochaetae-6]
MFEKLKEKLFSRNPKLPIFINSWNNRVIARKDEVFDAELLERAARMGKKFQNAPVAVSTSFIVEDMEKVLKKNPKIYGFITENLKFLDDLLDYVGRVKIPEQIISEISLIKENYSYNYHHIIAVTALSTRIARDFFLDDDKILEVAESCLLYDIGIGHVPAHIINKIGKLSDKEREIINFHPVYSALLLAHYYCDHNHPLIDTILKHHENLDGSGFPLKVANNNINSHILKISDTFDALISARPFRKFYSPKEAFKICEDLINAGKIAPDILPIIYSYYLFIDQYPED